EVARRISGEIVPRARTLVRYVDQDVRPRAPANVGMSQYPGGREAYRIKVKIETTLPDATPEQIYKNGLRGIASIDSQMKRIRDSLGFKGTRAAFHKQLRKDPQFYEKTPEGV